MENVQTKQCVSCSQIYPLADFPLAKNANNPSTFAYRAKTTLYKKRCKSCEAAYAREWRKKNKGYEGSGIISKYLDFQKPILSCISVKLTNCKSNSKKKGKTTPFNIDRDYLFGLYEDQKGLCALSGIKLSIEPNELSGLSIDKIIPELGYVKGNVQLLCWAVNRAKGEMSQEHFIQLCKTIAERCND